MRSDNITIFIPGIVRKTYNKNQVRHTTRELLRQEITEDFEHLYIMRDMEDNCYYVKFEGFPYSTGTKIRD